MASGYLWRLPGKRSGSREVRPHFTEQRKLHQHHPCFCRKIQWSELLAKELGIRRSGDHRSVISRKWTRREIYGKTFHCGFALESLTQFIVCGDASSHK